MKTKTIKHIIVFVCLLAMTVSCNQSTSYNDVDEMVAKAAKKVEAITAEELKEKIDNGDMILLIDVREPNEYNAGYIPGSLNIPRGTLEFKIGNEDFWEAEMLYMPEKDEELIIIPDGILHYLPFEVLYSNPVNPEEVVFWDEMPYLVLENPPWRSIPSLPRARGVMSNPYRRMRANFWVKWINPM